MTTTTTDDTLWGFQRLAQLYGIELVQPLLVRSQLGTVRRHTVVDGQEVRTWPAQYQPADTFRGHFAFGLKHERLHFEFFSRLFACLPVQEIVDWVQDEPTGSYARRTAFLYEWFTGQPLPVPDTSPNVGYVDAIDAQCYLVAPQPERVRRWRVNNNLPGVRDFCPLVWLGPEGERGWLYDVAAGVQQLDDTYGTELLQRSAAWLTLKESRASFAIEHEADKKDRVQRFAAAISAFSGQMQDPLSPQSLLTLQKAVLGGDQVLEVFSRPFMQAHAEAYRFGPQRTCPDGVVTDFVFTQTPAAQHAWRYPDLSAHVRYLSAVLCCATRWSMAWRRKPWHCAGTTPPGQPSRTGWKCPTRMPTAPSARSSKRSGRSTTNCARSCRPFFAATMDGRRRSWRRCGRRWRAVWNDRPRPA